MKRGFTLIELMVYIALLSIVILIAGRVYSDSTAFRLKTQGMLMATEEATKVGVLLQEDLASMGTKSWKVQSVSVDSFVVENLVYMDPDNSVEASIDSSSFYLRHLDDRDSIAFRRIEYNPDGTFLAVQEIEWVLKTDSSLWRACRTLHGTASSTCPSGDSPFAVLMANGVAQFSLTPGQFEAEPDTLFPADPSDGFRLISRLDASNLVNLHVSPSEGAPTVTLSNFARNFDPITGSPDLSSKFANEVYVADASSNSGNWSSLCKKFHFEAGETYSIRFNLPYQNNPIQMFRPELDHMAIGIRSKDEGNPIETMTDFLFYPPQSDSAKSRQKLDLYFNEDVSACVAFTFAFYSPVAHMGAMAIHNLYVIHEKQGEYEFHDMYSESSFAKTQKKKIKAFKLDLRVSKRGETGMTEVTIPVKNNGQKASSTLGS